MHGHECASALAPTPRPSPPALPWPGFGLWRLFPLESLVLILPQATALTPTSPRSPPPPLPTIRDPGCVFFVNCRAEMLALFVFALSAAVALAQNTNACPGGLNSLGWCDCAPANSGIVIQQFYFSPNPPVPGKNITGSITAKVSPSACASLAPNCGRRAASFLLLVG